MDAAELSFSNEGFENITFFYTLMYMNEECQRRAILEAARVLKKGGSLCIWDAELESAYPEAFIAELEIGLPCERIEVSYGIIRDGGQSASSVLRLCNEADLKLVRNERAEGHFYLHLTK